MAFKEKLQAMRRKERMSQENIAEYLGVSRQAVAKWEAGEAFPDIEKLIQISDLFCITIDSLVRTNKGCSDQEIIRKDISDNQIISFIKEASANSYAGKGKESEKHCRPNSHDFIYEKGNLKYIDTYVGGNVFSGEEVVFQGDIPIWSMNYCGRTLDGQFSGDFLKKVLLLRPSEIPFRGPRIYSEGGYVYHNTVEGKYNWFQGKEEIFYGDIKVYECFYHGGTLE